MLTSGVSNLLIGLLGVMMSTNQPAALSQLVAQKTGVQITLPDPTDPVEQEYEKLLAADDAAQTEVDGWIREAGNAAVKGDDPSKAGLAFRVEHRLEPVRKAYEDFINRHPKHVRARLAYGSFLNDTRDEEGALVQWEKAREMAPTNPATWNNLANQYGHRGPVKKAFEYYAKAIELNTNEPVYLHNLATTTYLFRKDAMEFYGITEPQVFDRSLELYRKALKLDPKNLQLATDLAQSYYGIKPLRAEDALAAWKYALSVAENDVEREGIALHLARIELNSGRFLDARAHLNAVTNQAMMDLKNRLLRNLAQKENGTNAPPAAANR